MKAGQGGQETVTRSVCLLRYTAIGSVCLSCYASLAGGSNVVAMEFVQLEWAESPFLVSRQDSPRAEDVLVREGGVCVGV